MHETKYLLSALAWRGLKLSQNEFERLNRYLPPYPKEKEILEALTAEYRLKLSFEKGWYDQCRSEIDWLWNFGARLVTIMDDEYPNGLREFRDAPLALTVKGDAVWQTHETMAVVGSRNPSQASLRWLEDELDKFLEVRNICIVSGGARGIDQRAHAIALRKRRPTVCFVPAGLGALYPRQLSEWVRPIVDGGGALVSTYAPAHTMEKCLFIERNRYIAALTQSTLIVEAKRRSGTMVTARWASALERPVGVVPCSPTAAGLGGLDLLADEGLLIRDHKDLIILAERGRLKSLRLFLESESQGQNLQEQ